jgi:hypothetical protein
MPKPVWAASGRAQATSARTTFLTLDKKVPTTNSFFQKDVNWEKNNKLVGSLSNATLELTKRFVSAAETGQSGRHVRRLLPPVNITTAERELVV